MYLKFQVEEWSHLDLGTKQELEQSQPRWRILEKSSILQVYFLTVTLSEELNIFLVKCGINLEINRSDSLYLFLITHLTWISPLYLSILRGEVFLLELMLSFPTKATCLPSRTGLETMSLFLLPIRCKLDQI